MSFENYLPYSGPSSIQLLQAFFLHVDTATRRNTVQGSQWSESDFVDRDKRPNLVLTWKGYVYLDLGPY